MSNEDDDEKVCLTGGQVQNIAEAYKEVFPGKPKKVCPKAKRWVEGYFGKPKEEKDTAEKVVSQVARKVERGIIGKGKAKLKEKLGALGDLF